LCLFLGNPTLSELLNAILSSVNVHGFRLFGDAVNGARHHITDVNSVELLSLAAEFGFVPFLCAREGHDPGSMSPIWDREDVL
jgi:hypothetical protein